MRHNTHDKTLYRNYVRKWKFLIQEYELVKQKRHPKFRFVADFYRFHQTHRQTFFKYYHRFRQSGAEHALVPQPRGPKWKSRRVYAKCCSSGGWASTGMRFAESAMRWRRYKDKAESRRIRASGTAIT